MAFSSLICLFSTLSQLIVHVALRTCKDGIYNSCCDLKLEMTHSIVFLSDRKSSRKLSLATFGDFVVPRLVAYIHFVLSKPVEILVIFMEWDKHICMCLNVG